MAFSRCGSLLEASRREALADAFHAAAKDHPIELHFQKGLSGASEEVVATTRNTATNPDVLDAFVLAIIAGEGQPAYPGLPGHEPDVSNARKEAAQIDSAMLTLKMLAPDAGSYVAESNYFEAHWQTSYWGGNYARLLELKRKYDPEGVFFVRHGVGSEGWSDDGFARLPSPG